jgi:hypothetical protein
MKVQEWPSLAAQVGLSKQLFDATGPNRLQVWLDEQITRIDDSAFARQFSDHITLPGIAEQDFNHRHVRTRSGSLLGGIRFFGGDKARPFVEIVAHTFEESAEGIEALVELVAREWQAFKPRHLRLLLVPEQLHSFNSARPFNSIRPFNSARPILIDMSVHAARYKDMLAPDGRVGLAAFKTADDAINLVQERYRDIAEHQPELAQNISAADAKDIRAWYDAGQVRAITACNKTVGLLAIAPGAIEWLDGDEINEEVIATPHIRNGYAAEAQKVWAAEAKNQNCLLLGTIDRLNPASRKTAEAVGRKSVLNYVFINL